MSLCEALKTSPDTREPQTLAGAACAALTRALAARRGGGCHPQRRMGESVTVTWLSTTTPERVPAAAPHWRPSSTRSPPRSPNSRPQPPGARPDASTAHTAFPSSRGTCPTPPGTSPVRPGPLTGVVSAGRARCCGGRGPMKKLIVVLAACARQVGEADGASPEAPRGGNAHQVTCAVAPARE